LLQAEAAERALDVIRRNAHAQVPLIDDLLDVSRIIAGKMRLDVRPVDLEAVRRQPRTSPGRPTPPAVPSATTSMPRRV
jgi:signal transduction histidine kinase